MENGIIPFRLKFSCRIKEKNDLECFYLFFYFIKMRGKVVNSL